MVRVKARYNLQDKLRAIALVREGKTYQQVSEPRPGWWLRAAGQIIHWMPGVQGFTKSRNVTFHKVSFPLIVVLY